jgi:hypothetical protein
MLRSISRFVLLCGLLTLAAAVEGCQRGPRWNLVPVEGTVTKGGRPLADIQVTFWADSEAGTQGPRSSGTTDEAGHYRLRTDNGDDGAVLGKHRVLILDPAVRMGRAARGPQRKEATRRLSPKVAKRLEEQMKLAADAPRVPPRYGRFNDTPLRVEVHPGPQVIDLEVKGSPD